ncbi:NAD(P)/FAD-dependent oxidoreductase [Corynebacterium bovis]|uniref:NAD(P)/FAD-dependent oxidoreductase n=1 Tax=Corynebacterium bovis TaxID=36808 RepID=UPI003139BC16
MTSPHPDPAPATRPDDAADRSPAPGDATVTDVLIVGGGPAGLAAATVLGRSRRSVVVVDSGEPRNAPAAGAHNVLGLEGTPPRDILDRGRRESERYGVPHIRARVTDAGRDSDLLTVTTDDGRTLRGRRLLLATGLTDVLPDIPGLDEGWGRDVLHCPYCHGWEVRDKRIAVIAATPQSTHQALLFANLSDRVTFVTGTVELDDDQRSLLARAGVETVGSPVTRVSRPRGVGGVVHLHLANGTEMEVDAVAVGPSFESNTELYERLGGTPAEHPMGHHIPAEPTGRTPLDGVWAAGNAGDLMAMVESSAAAGVTAGSMINAELVMADLPPA